MAAKDPIAIVAQELNKVKSVGQARAAIGATLKHISHGYKVADKLTSISALTSVNRDSARRTLDGIRSKLEQDYKALPDADTWAVPDSWPRTRSVIQVAFIEIAGIEGAVGAKPTSGDVAGIIGTSILEAPGVFAKKVGEVVKVAGETAGQAAVGLVSGIGLPMIAVIGVIVFLVLRARKAVV